MLRRSSDANRTTRSGEHQPGAMAGAVHPGPGPGRRQRPTSGQSPKTGAKPDYNGIHPERIKELKNDGEEQAEDQVSESSSPFGSGHLNTLGMPEEEEDGGGGTLPYDHPTSNEQRESLPHPKLKRPTAVVGQGGYVPHADKESGGMHVKTRRGGSNFYGD